MMLATIADFKPNMTLVQNSGIQFLDFALTPDLNNDWPGEFVRETSTVRCCAEVSCRQRKIFAAAAAGTPAEVVKPEFSFPLAQSLRLLCGQWLPLPFFRFNPPRTFIGGPDNWARVQVVALDKPDASGNTHRIVLAFDTRVWADGEDETLALNENDVKNGVNFALAWRSDELGEFLDHTWIDGWLREAFSDSASALEQRPQVKIKAALREFEYQAHYLNILHMLVSS